MGKARVGWELSVEKISAAHHVAQGEEGCTLALETAGKLASTCYSSRRNVLLLFGFVQMRLYDEQCQSRLVCSVLYHAQPLSVSVVSAESCRVRRGWRYQQAQR